MLVLYFQQLQDSLKKAALKGRSGIVRYRAGLCFGILALMGCNDNAYVDVGINSCSSCCCHF